MHVLTLHLQPDRYAVCRLGPSSVIPDWASSGEVFSIIRTPEELSIVCGESAVPEEPLTVERGWRIFKLQGPFPFEMTGVLASVLVPLAEAGVNIFALSTYDTDYMLVKDEQREMAIRALTQAGHHVERQ